MALWKMLAIIMALLLPSACRAADIEEEKAAKSAALEAARKWLVLVDGGDYGGAYKTMAPQVQQMVTSQQWEEITQAVRGRLGKVLDRKPLDATYRELELGLGQIPKVDAPPPAVVTFRFQTAFAAWRSTVETIQVVRDDDGNWAVVGATVLTNGRR